MEKLKRQRLLHRERLFHRERLLHRERWYRPKFEGPFRNWALKYMGRNLWRVSFHLEFQDLMQEAFLVFDRCLNCYPYVEHPSHFMRLFQISLVNEMNDLANRSTRGSFVIPEAAIRKDPELWGETHISQLLENEPIEMDGYGAFNVLMRQVPKEVGDLLKALVNDGTRHLFQQDRRRRCYLGGRRKKPLQRRETNNQFFCRILEHDPDLVNIATDLEDHFKEADQDLGLTWEDVSKSMEWFFKREFLDDNHQTT